MTCLRWPPTRTVSPPSRTICHQGLFLIELPAELIKITNFKFRTEFDFPFLRFEFTQEELEQRRLAAAIRADHPDAIAAHEA